MAKHRPRRRWGAPDRTRWRRHGSPKDQWRAGPDRLAPAQARRRL